MRAEPGMGGIALSLYDSFGIVSATSSNSDGTYTFLDPVPAGTYTSVTIDNLLQYIAANPMASPGARVDVVGIGDDQVAARTVPDPLSRCG